MGMFTVGLRGASLNVRASLNVSVKFSAMVLHV